MNRPLPVIASSETGTKNPAVDRFPDKCPICHYAIDVRRLHPYLHEDNLHLEMIFQCPRPECHHFFIGYYVTDFPHNLVGALPAGDVPNLFYILEDVRPTEFSVRDFGEVIKSISNDFVKIYNQSAHAEMLELDMICGTGYRKSLEFLIKDYTIQRNPTHANEIKAEKKLAKVINQYVDDTRIKTVAERAAWLGNDETHYDRKWEEKDINDLKKLIDLTVLWIESEKLSEDYLKTMPKGKI